jgi:hypothetical protein
MSGHGPKANKTAKASRYRNSRAFNRIRKTRNRAKKIAAAAAAEEILAAAHRAALEKNALDRLKLIKMRKVPMPWLKEESENEMNELGEKLRKVGV